MARVEARQAPAGPWVIVAEGEAELELLAFYLARPAGTLVLDGASYPVRGETLIIPDSISEQGLQRVRQAFQRAATSHQRASQRRKGFAVIDASD